MQTLDANLIIFFRFLYFIVKYFIVKYIMSITKDMNRYVLLRVYLLCHFHSKIVLVRYMYELAVFAVKTFPLNHLS